MSESRFDAIVIGSGLGGLTAAALLAKEGRNVCVLERNHALGGAASVFRAGGLTIEPSLHQTADPRDPVDPKHYILKRLGLLDEIDWVPIRPFMSVEGGPVGDAFDLPCGFDAAREALAARFPKSATGLRALVGDIQAATLAVGRLQEAREARSLGSLWRAATGLRALSHDWRMSLADKLAKYLADDEAAKLAFASNLGYYADAPERLSWPFFAIAQGGFLKSGGVFVKGGSHRLSIALAKLVTQAGGRIRMGREATGIELGGDGRTEAVVHVDAKHRQDRERIAAPLVLTNAAPGVTAAMLPPPARAAMEAAYAGPPLSVSLFAAYFGLNRPPSSFGLNRYGVARLPPWLGSLSDFAACAGLLANPPAGRLPPYALTNYGAIDSGLGDGRLTLVSAVGLDRVENWVGLGKEEETRRRELWLDALLADIDRAHPGFAAAVETRLLLNARSMRDFLGTPDGALYGFAPLPFQRGVLAGFPRTPQTPVPGLLLASSFSGFGGFTGAMRGGAEAAAMASG